VQGRFGCVRLLVVARDRRARELLVRTAEAFGWIAVAVPTPDRALAALGRSRFDMVVTRASDGGRSAMALAGPVPAPHRPARVIELGRPSLRRRSDRGRATAAIEIEVDQLQHRLRRLEPGARGRELAGAGSATDVGAAHDLGSGRLEARVVEGRSQNRLRIDASTAPPNLIGRLLVGSYITGQDQIRVAAAGGLTRAQRSEIHRVVDRTLGMTVVRDSADEVVVQNFVDPARFELPRLLTRVVDLLRSELSLCRQALVDGSDPGLGQIDVLEEEVDRLYLLMARQLLLSTEDPRIARSIDVESRHYQMGDRLVAKVLEVTGDLVYSIGTELRKHPEALHRLARPLRRTLAEQVRAFERLLVRTSDAFSALSVVEANATLNLLNGALPEAAEAGPRLVQHLPDLELGVLVQRILCDLAMGLEMMVIVNEVTINRSVEPEPVPSGTRPPGPVARTGERDRDRGRSSLAPPKR